MMRTCPHCGRNVWTPRGVSHETQCIALNHTKYATMMNRGDGCIMAFHEWGRVSKSAGLLGCAGLLQACNAKTWGDVAAYFGLEYKPTPGVVRNASPEAAAQRRRARAELDAPLTDAERHACARRGATQFAGERGLHSHWQVVDVR